MNGDVLKDIDLVVMATGYHQRFPFLDHIWPLEKQHRCELYRYAVPTEPELDGLGFIMVRQSFALCRKATPQSHCMSMSFRVHQRVMSVRCTHGCNTGPPPFVAVGAACDVLSSAGG